MGWLFKERGPAWRRGWTYQTVSSISAIPLPLLAVFGVIFFYQALTWYMHFRAEFKRNLMIRFKLFLFLLPVILIFLVRSLKRFPSPRATVKIVRMGTNFPWGLAALIVMLLLMVSFRSSVHSMWLPPIWRTF